MGLEITFLCSTVKMVQIWVIVVDMVEICVAVKRLQIWFLGLMESLKLCKDVGFETTW